MTDESRSIPVHLFRESFSPFMELLNANGAKYRIHAERSGAIMNAGGVIELLIAPAMWAALAVVVVAFIKSRHGRSVLITYENGRSIEAKGLTSEELDKALRHSVRLAAIDPNPPSKDPNP